MKRLIVFVSVLVLAQLADAGSYLGAFTTTSLPACPGTATQGDFAWVTDADAPGTDPAGWDCEIAGLPQDADTVLCSCDAAGAGWIALRRGSSVAGAPSEPSILLESTRAGYTPAVPGDWTDPDPDRVSKGLDALAAALGGEGALEAKLGIDIIVDGETQQVFHFDDQAPPSAPSDGFSKLFVDAASVLQRLYRKASTTITSIVLGTNVGLDMDLDGNADTIYCSDRDGDGTLEADDIRLCIDDLMADTDSTRFVRVMAGDYGCVPVANEGGDPPGAYDSGYNACLEIPSDVHLLCDPGAKLVGRNVQDTGASGISQFSTVANLNRASTTTVDRDFRIEGCEITGGMPEGTIGKATAGTTTTLTDAGRAWATNQWALPVYGDRLVIRPGKSTREVSTIVSNTADTITVSPAFSVAPAPGDIYHVSHDYAAIKLAYSWTFGSRMAVNVQNAVNFEFVGNTVRFSEHTALYTSETTDVLVQNNVLEFCGGFLASNLDGEATYPCQYRFSRESDCVDLFDTGGPPQTSGNPDGFCDSDGTSVTTPAGIGNLRRPGTVGFRQYGNVMRYTPSNLENARLNQTSEPVSHMAGIHSEGNYYVQGYTSQSNTSVGGCVAVAGSGVLRGTTCDGPGSLSLSRVESGSYVVEGYTHACHESIHAPDCVGDSSANVTLGGENLEHASIVLRNLTLDVTEAVSTSGARTPCISVSNYGTAVLEIDGFDLRRCGGNGININPSQTIGNFDDHGDQLTIQNGKIANTGIGDLNFLNAGSGIEIVDPTDSALIANVSMANLNGPMIRLAGAHKDLQLRNVIGDVNGPFFQGTATIAALPTCGSTEAGQSWLFTDAATATDCATGGGARDNLCACDGSSFIDANEHTGISVAASATLTRPRWTGIGVINPGDRARHAIDLAEAGVTVSDGFLSDAWMRNELYASTLDAPNGLLDLATGASGIGTLRLGDGLRCSGVLRSGFNCIDGNDENAELMGRLFVSNGTTLDTGDEACPSPQRCLRVWDGGNQTTAALDLKTCSETVTSGNEFMAFCE